MLIETRKSAASCTSSDGEGAVASTDYLDPRSELLGRKERPLLMHARNAEAESQPVESRLLAGWRQAV